jgi:adenine phosphoribosyltransferase
MTFKILLCSESPIKHKALVNVVANDLNNVDFLIENVNGDPIGLPPQPFGCDLKCAYERVIHARKFATRDWTTYDAIVGIENGLFIDASSGDLMDRCSVCVLLPGSMTFIDNFYGNRDANFKLPMNTLPFMGNLVRYSDNIQGYNTTAAEVLVENKLATNVKDWIGTSPTGTTRCRQIEMSILPVFRQIGSSLYCLKKTIPAAVYSNWPKPGVEFVDFFDISLNYDLMISMMSKILVFYGQLEITAVVGLESRGFVVGTMLAMMLRVPFIPVRKAGKLPGKVLTLEYKTEYSSDKIEIQDNGEKHRVIVADDFIATGGTLDAANKLLTAAGHTVVDMFVLFEQKSLRSIAQAKIGRPYSVFFNYEAKN